MRPRRRPVHGLLLATVVVTVAVLGAVPPSGIQDVIVNLLLGAALILSLHIARTSRTLVALAYVLAGLGVAVAVVRASTDAIGVGEARVMSAVVVAAGPPAVAIGIVRNLRSSGRVPVEAVTGVLSLYMLLGMLFAFVYGAIDTFGHDPFFADGVKATASHCLYFSFTTLTTVGFGDLTARSDVGHTVTIFEALLGQIYLVTVVSLIVGNLGREHPRRS